MTAKEYLSSVYWMERQLGYDRQELANWAEMSVGVQAVNYEPHYGSGKSGVAPFIHCLEKKTEAEIKIQKDMVELVERKSDIIEKLSQMSNLEHKTVLEQRYLSHRSWKEIAKALSYSPRWIYTLHDQALLEFEALMTQEDLKKAM